MWHVNSKQNSLDAVSQGRIRMTPRRKRISIEREIALWRGGRPLPRQETDRFKSLIEKHKESIGVSAVEREVATNSLEVTFSLIRRSSFRERLYALRSEVGELARSEGVEICWTNQPRHTPEGHNEFFTTMVFPSLVNTFTHANSLHIHFETEPSEAVTVYRNMNALAPSFMVRSSAQGGGVCRLGMAAEFTRVFGELALPQHITSVQEYAEYMVRMSREMEMMMATEGTLAKAALVFPKMFDSEGRLSLTPDKIFHPARIRPDMELSNGNISLEFRAIDAIADVAVEADMVDRAIDAYDSPPVVQSGIGEARKFLRDLAGIVDLTGMEEQPVAEGLHAYA